MVFLYKDKEINASDAYRKKLIFDILSQYKKSYENYKDKLDEKGIHFDDIFDILDVANYSNRDLKKLYGVSNCISESIAGLLEDAKESSFLSKLLKGASTAGLFSYLLFSAPIVELHNIASADVNQSVSGRIVSVNADDHYIGGATVYDVNLGLDVDNDGIADNYFTVDSVENGKYILEDLLNKDVMILVDSEGNPHFGAEDGTGTIIYDYNSDGNYEGIIRILDDDIVYWYEQEQQYVCRARASDEEDECQWEYTQVEKTKYAPNNEVKKINSDADNESTPLLGGFSALLTAVGLKKYFSRRKGKNL